MVRQTLRPGEAVQQGGRADFDVEDFESALADYLDWPQQFVDAYGELIERYRQRPLMPSFMKDDDDEPAVAKRKAIPVPKGPVEVW